MTVRTTAALALAGLGSAVVVGCGGSTPTTADNALVAWATGYCRALRPMAAAELGADGVLTAKPLDLAGIAEALTSLEPAYVATAAALEELSPPPMPDGAGLLDRVTHGMTSVGSSYGDLGDQLRAVDPDDGGP